MENIFEDAMSFIESREEKTIEIPITLGEFKDLAIETIKKDTGVDLKDRLNCDYDKEVYSIITIINEEDLTEDELNNLGKYHPDKRFLNTELVLTSFFEEAKKSIYICTNQDDVKYCQRVEKDITCYIYIDYDDLFKIKKSKKEKKEVWKIPVQWSNFGVIEVEASSLKEALKDVYYNPDTFNFPHQHDYIDGSFEPCLEDKDDLLNKVNIDYIEKFNKQTKIQRR